MTEEPNTMTFSKEINPDRRDRNTEIICLQEGWGGSFGGETDRKTNCKK